jgi:hypothetical protein
VLDAMKLAFCFATAGDLLHPGVWERFFSAAPAAERRLYCRSNDPALVESALLKGRIIGQDGATNPGDGSLAEAALALFSAAYRDDPETEYFILLSGSTIPIVAFAEIRARLAGCGGRSLIAYRVPQAGSEHHRRLTTMRDGALFAREFYWHDPWIVLHRRHVEALIRQSFLPLFEGLTAAEEHYVMNVLVHLQNVPIDEVINIETTFVNWTEPEEVLAIAPLTRRIVGLTVRPKSYRTLAAADLAAAGDCWFLGEVAACCACDLVLPGIGARIDGPGAAL